MDSPNWSVESLTGAWRVLALFVIPIGGGIPAGVLLARDQGLSWGFTSFLYFISDVILACVFEPFVLALILASRRSRRVARFRDVLKMAIQKTTPQFGSQAGPLALILIAFGADPMTGRLATRAAGHGFLSGWILAIAGDMIYFTILMASTLWLNGILGDGTWTTMIILVGMVVIPLIVRRVREAWRGSDPGTPM
jgi:hypothetical protein